MYENWIHNHSMTINKIINEDLERVNFFILSKKIKQRNNNMIKRERFKNKCFVISINFTIQNRADREILHVFSTLYNKICKIFRKICWVIGSLLIQKRKACLFYKPSILYSVVEIVFLPLVFDIYNAQSADWINACGFSKSVGTIAAIPILIVTILEMSELI